MATAKKASTEEVSINGIVYVPKAEFGGEARIVILQRGWIYVGKFKREGDVCELNNASNIRVWGTTKGLGELVEGPTAATKLDLCKGRVEFNWNTVVHTIDVNPEKWGL